MSSLVNTAPPRVTAIRSMIRDAGGIHDPSRNVVKFPNGVEVSENALVSMKPDELEYMLARFGSQQYQHEQYARRRKYMPHSLLGADWSEGLPASLVVAQPYINMETTALDGVTCACIVRCLCPESGDPYHPELVLPMEGEGRGLALFAQVELRQNGGARYYVSTQTWSLYGLASTGMTTYAMSTAPPPAIAQTPGPWGTPEPPGPPATGVTSLDGLLGAKEKAQRRVDAVLADFRMHMAAVCRPL